VKFNLIKLETKRNTLFYKEVNRKISEHLYICDCQANENIGKYQIAIYRGTSSLSCFRRPCMWPQAGVNTISLLDILIASLCLYAKGK